jgi:hypothetical protein
MNADSVTILRAHERRMAKAYVLATNGVVTKRTDANAAWFTAESRTVNGIADIHQLLVELEPDPFACIIRGGPVEDVDLRRVRRKKNGPGAAFVETPRHWVMVDVDGIALPPATSVLADPADAGQAVLDMLTAVAPELEGVAAVVQFSSSAALDEVAEAEESAGLPARWRGVAKAGVSAHIWFWTAQAYGEAELTRWSAAVNEAAGGKLVDPATVRTVQAHFVAAPVFGQGLRDPLAGRRTLFIPGAVDEAALNIPEVKPRSHTAGAGEGTAHGGRGYAGHLADIGGVEGFRAPMLRAVAAFVATNWPEPDLAALKRDIRARIDAADPGGRSQDVLEEYAGRGLDQLITWTMDREGEKRETEAAERRTAQTEPTFPNRAVPLVEAQAQADKALVRFADRMRAGEKPELLLQMTVGAGKSEAAIRQARMLLDAARDGGRGGALVYLVPRHDLGAELVERFAAAHPGMAVGTWRGMDAADPARQGYSMCLDPALPRAAAEAGLAHTAACGACPLRGECGSRAQAKQRADVWLLAHNSGFLAKPAAVPDAALVVVDESFMGAAMVGTDADSRLVLAIGELDDERTGAVTGLDRGKLLAYRRRARDVLQAHEVGGLLRQAFAPSTKRTLYRDGDDVLQESFAEAGLTGEAAEEWLRLEWRTKPPEPKLQGVVDRGGILEKLREAKAAGFNRRRAILAKHVRDLLAGDAVRSVNAELVDGGTAVAFAWREDFADWIAEAPKLFLDATTAPELLRVWSPALEVSTIEVDAPLQRVRQIVGAEFGRAMFTSNASNVRRLADLVVVELAEAVGDVLVVAQVVVEALLRKELIRRFGEIPARLHLAHHGGLTGMNTWSAVERVLVVGRPAMNRQAGERLAEIVRGGAVEVEADGDAARWPTVTAGIRMWDGTGRPVRQPRHEDPLVEALRWSITEGAVLQAVGRGRGVQRTSRPVHVTIMNELALPLTVQRVETWDEVQPDRIMVAAAEAALTGAALPLAVADLVAAGVFETEKAAERYREERKYPPQSLIGTLYKRLGGVIPCRYRKAGGRGPASMALVPRAGARQALEALLGPLSYFELVETVPETPTTRQAQIEPVRVYPGGVLEPPPVDMVAVRGAGGRRVALVEVPGMGAFAGAQAVTQAGLGALLLLRRPEAPDPVPWLARAMLAPLARPPRGEVRLH